MHDQAMEQEKIMHNVYRFARSQTYIQNEEFTKAVYANNLASKLLIQDAMQVRPLSGDTVNRLVAVDADFRRNMELIHSVRPSQTQLSAAVKNQENLRKQGALGIRFGQTGEKTAQ
ncbi:hypothetical protein M5689_018907 [Euphorbia peplus]|nr:hypothetical protein M5689_018907 [Euphorbia peplus]